MNLLGLKKHLLRTYPILALEKNFSHDQRRKLKKVFNWLMFLSVVGLIINMALFREAWLSSETITGVFIILLVFRVILFLLDAFFFSSYFYPGAALADFETAQLIYSLQTTDVTGTFISSKFGQEVLLRAGVPNAEIQTFLNTRVGRLALAQLVIEPLDPGSRLTSSDLLRSIYKTDHEFSQFLFKFGIQVDDLLGTAAWVNRTNFEHRVSERWWDRESLGRIPGLAKDWSYGQVYNLAHYAEPVLATEAKEKEYHYNQNEVKKVEAALSREREDNVMLISDDEQRKSEIVSRLSRLIEEGTVFPQLEHKKIFLFNATSFSAANDQKGNFEQEFIKTMNEAEHAGNLIVVFPEFTALARSAEALGSNLISLIGSYLKSPNLQIIAECTTGEFHQEWERRPEVMERFEKIILEEIAEASVLRALEDEATQLEPRQGVVFTRPALQAIASGAERYFPGGILPDAAIDLAYDLATRHEGNPLIQKTDVEKLIKEKTGIPVGAIDDDERTKLTNLEQILHERIVGQDEAISGLANALRRSRAGISNPNRPIGAFLFLGPTGVGKTETTKALAKAYFGDENKINRLDMSEYSSPEALDKLIGAFSGRQAGVLSDMIRERPYGILLLDEFEKASLKVHNLFLQILDEGFFSDMSGRRVNVRNHMIIATSNAGSGLIWQTLSSGADLLAEKPKIIDELIRQDIFKPELLNRFDGVILFHPLSPEALKQVARLMLQKLAERLRARGTELAVSDELVDYVAKQGTDIKFGARAMSRTIQDTVEQAVANKIVIEGLKPGQVVSLSPADML